MKGLPKDVGDLPAEDGELYQMVAWGGGGYLWWCGGAYPLCDECDECDECSRWLLGQLRTGHALSSCVRVVGGVRVGGVGGVRVGGVGGVGGVRVGGVGGVRGVGGNILWAQCQRECRSKECECMFTARSVCMFTV